MRPDVLVVVAGTGTEVGKTWVASALARSLRSSGVGVAAWKPAQSFEPGAGPTDAELLAAATGQDPGAVCPEHRWYERPLAPPMAAEVLGRPAIRLTDLVDEVRWPDVTQVGLVETAGGVRSPLAIDGDAVDLVAALAPDLVVLVADAGLGTISDVRLSAGALADHRLVVMLNRYDAADDLHVANAEWLRARDSFDVVDSIDLLADRVRPADRGRVEP